MSFKDRVIDFCLIGVAVGIGFVALWYGITHTRWRLPLPAAIKESLPFQSRQLTPMQVDLVAPFPGQEDVSTYPTISLQSKFILGENVATQISPTTSFKTSLSKDGLTLTVALANPLKPQTQYVVTVTDPTTLTTYQWSFKTGSRVVDSALARGITKLNQALPYTDPSGQFSIYYAPQTDRYFITVHDDERNIAETQAAYNWMRSFGINDINLLQTTITPTTDF